MITLLDHFTWNFAATSSFETPWVAFPSEYQQAALWVDTKVASSNAVTVEVESSADTTSSISVISTTTPGTPGITETAIGSLLGPLVRLKLSTSGAAAQVLLSVWLIPKID